MVNHGEIKEVYKRIKENQETNKKWTRDTHPLPSPHISPPTPPPSKETLSPREIDSHSIPQENDFDFDIKNFLKDVKFFIPLYKLMKMPHIYKNMHDDIIKDPPVFIQSEQKIRETKGGAQPPFFMTLDIDDYTLHNCMFDT